MASSTMSSDTNQTDTDQDFLQKHVAFFDRNKDGIINPWETFQGFRAIGVGILLSTVASLAFLSTWLSVTLLPWFVPSKFQENFKNYAHTYPDALTSDELSEMLKAKREPMDCIGWIAAFLEWKILFYMYKDVNGLLCKETIRRVYDGSLFEQMDKERQSSKKKA
ncbi:hypothetical protein Dsin_008954 [Dipteronia sinensis]|uniref:Uncharacterized protein n=1 Tax=Dipteronia sinensis TaxID=43782 RepID=A0AAE0AQT3_9ROSI|nr:hypothetical protein Dsin_008954 [Dipteronia sinensis]